VHTCDFGTAYRLTSCKPRESSCVYMLPSMTVAINGPHERDETSDVLEDK
jgi:hypothetical protein